MKNPKLKRILIAILAVISVLAILFIYFSTKKTNKPSEPVAIISSVPANDSQNASVFDPIKITFNQTVDPADLSVISVPAEDWTVSSNTQDSVSLNHKVYLRVATNYKLTISYKGSVLGILNFETVKSQNDPRQLQNLQSELNRDYPLASLTPYETADYRVVYSAPLTLEIDLKSSISSEDAISQIKSWVKTNGVDPDTHKYVVVSSPSK